MNGLSGAAPAQNVANYLARQHIRNFSNTIMCVTRGCVTNAIVSLKHCVGSTYLRARFKLSVGRED